MVPFKRVFLGEAPPPAVRRATSAQKCLRTNDIEQVGVTSRHQTFFEMLGNFSFGDYFKADAIPWAWALLTDVYGIPPERLAVSVYTDDDEAYALWRDVVGVPAARIQRLGEEDNFWASGPTGPCGPCSEIYYDFDPTSAAAVDVTDDGRFIEIYNLVFMQHSRDAGGRLTDLASKNIDTGLGLERLARVLQAVDSNFETDALAPIVAAAAAAAGLPRDLAGAPPAAAVSLKVVGDHARAVLHLAVDGVVASNVGRGYVLRRLLRRMVRHGRLLGVDGPFVEGVLRVAAGLAVEAGYTAVGERLEGVLVELGREEARFLSTLARGEDRLAETLAAAAAAAADAPDGAPGVVSGADAFELYDTFGFPVELTSEAAAAAGLALDEAAFHAAMDAQRARARAARPGAAAVVHADEAGAVRAWAAAAGATRFVGYDALVAAEAVVLATRVERAAGGDGNGNGDGSGNGERAAVALNEPASVGETVTVILDATPFYAVGGGQVADGGTLTAGPLGDGATATATVSAVVREPSSGAYLHTCVVTAGRLAVGDTVTAAVTPVARRRAAAHHSATHLLAAALRATLPDGGSITQAGSAVDAERLRFDITYPRALTPAEVAAVEARVNAWVDAALPAAVSVTSVESAVAAGAVALPGEQYPDPSAVRVVAFGAASTELCGGTHVANTADIGPFKITGEAGIAAGVRRLEAAAGSALLPLLSARDATVRALTAALACGAEELPARVSALADEARAGAKAAERLRGELASARAAALLPTATTVGGGGGGGCTLLVGRVDDGGADALKAAAESLGRALGDRSVVVLGGATGDGKVALVVAAAPGVAAKKGGKGGGGVHAGKLVAEVAKMTGGGGGGARRSRKRAGGT
ncbi:hypothetical protein BU14_0666s0009 [Porphyra umbilicalis]|uniref:Alanine--tRNA ligase n=1 Tax=Porphyra umbilicalis TaxID=2786 RepID=A0A1X6NQY7_PORUM|nr:hypothetical protein BU14_0666s0009 [Porphyra umbilicalis]|eukprot:OSX70803.1 hypothetical protein BU14_0666s0009 [Porphyra umbilicalis]